MAMIFKLPAATVDTIEALTSAERLLVWGLRVTVTHAKNNLSQCPAVRTAMEQLGVGDLAHCIDGLVNLIGHTALRLVDVRCQACPDLSPDEALLLFAAERVQAAAERNAAQALAEILPARAMPFALGMLGGVAFHLAQIAVTLPYRPFRRPEATQASAAAAMHDCPDASATRH